ncbi:heme utilization cystosolic carrier protein HutX [uncultured Vibrio sp.]|uniref:heme utilization cystosolic carrier protein HutX n=1 Tax=uncultured Vibrio sp. TaxID=114054 RepID=UPI0025F9DD71|nr:heme utilization cystosolic carrier protein HutX [uncultured Vibrio sp.]
MFVSNSFFEVKEKVANALAIDDGMAVSSMAQQLDLTEGEVTLALPEECVQTIDGTHTEVILTQLPDWGKVTTIVHSFGSIFEFKNPFPKGKVAHGYYNIMGKEGLHGHLKIDLVKHIAFVSKPFKTMESHYIGFYTQEGHCVFKVYLGRDKSRQLFPQQIEAFQALKKEFLS